MIAGFGRTREGSDMTEKPTAERDLSDFRWLIKIFREMEQNGLNSVSKEPFLKMPDKPSRRPHRTKHARSPQATA